MKTEQKVAKIKEVVGNKLHFLNFTDPSMKTFLRKIVFNEEDASYWISFVAPLVKECFPEERRYIDAILNS